MALNLTGRTILIVDDERFSRATVARLLEDMGEPHIVHAANGDEAMGQLTSDDLNIDMVISDFNMPDKHGLDLLKSVRVGEEGIKRTMPFAILTGYSDKHLVDLALGLDVNAFLIKPVSKKGLEARINKMIRHALTGNWLKSESEYHDLNVASSLEEILGFQRQSEDKPKARGVFTLKKGRSLLRNPMPSDVFRDEDLKAHELEDEALGLDDSTSPAKSGGSTAPASPAKFQGGGYECPVDQVPEGAILARDVHTADGRLFMHAGAHITERVASILIDLQDLGHPVDSVWLKNRT